MEQEKCFVLHFFKFLNDMDQENCCANYHCEITVSNKIVAS
jgi:hypothetical protein